MSLIKMICHICEELIDVTNMAQLSPCLHITCKNCIDNWKKISGICLELQCFSPISSSENIAWNQCDNLCSHRLGPSCETYNLTVCKHELCIHCYKDVMRGKKCCPVVSCGAEIDEAEDTAEMCEACNQVKELDDIILMKCCKRKFCRFCLTQMYGDESTKIAEQQRCLSGKCIEKSVKKSKAEAVAACSNSQDCDNDAIRGFPSKEECEHSVCLECLRKMLKESMLYGQFPVCPIQECQVSYRVDSVLALKTMFPEHASYFTDMELGFQHVFEGIRDDSKEALCNRMSYNATKNVNLLQIRCKRNDEDDERATVEVISNIALGELVREVRLKLGILDCDRIYGYYIELEGGKIEESVTVGQKNRDDPITSIKAFSVPDKISFIVDMTGIVRSKYK